MKLSTRLVAILALTAATLAPALAATITVEVGDNFYRGPDGTPTIRMTVNDELVFQNVGSGTHPTASAQWITFIISPTRPTETFASGRFTAGTYPFLCTSHGGMTGTLIVTAATPTATLDARTAGISLSVYPNPSRGQVIVQLNQRPGQDYKLRLSNIIGQEIRTIALKPELTAAGLPVDLNDLRSGVYFYSLLVEGKVVATKRLVLQN
ncbi:MAG TPA: T9SS type A sorting domain-containing protein [Hymenobacter sp.]|jgi:plastocyanin|uniref:T9SS type A sorting domain-containing protein n=1 Tax=Hymenobacter sp. TaxID=1898978 RepID=UPI002EDA9D39